MLSFRNLTVSALFIGAMSLAAHAAEPERWIPTWAAPDVAGVDQPEQTLSSAAPAFPWVNDVPDAVREAAPGQQLEVGGYSRLHFNNQTIRQIAHVSTGGGQVRVVLSNTFGTEPLHIGAAQIALRDEGSSIVAGTNHVLTFGGLAQPAIPPGALLVSDPVDLTVPDFADVVVDLHLPGDTAAANSPVTVHPASWQTNYVSTQGNHAGVVTFPVAETTAYRRRDGLPSASSFFLSRIEVVAVQPTGVLVAFGDSITDGTQSGIDQNRRWPNLLASRLADAGISMSVVNGGIGGGQVLEGGTGPNGLARFDRDVLALPGVTHVTVMLGINDVRGGEASAAELIAGHRQFIDRARAHGIRVYGATLTPFEGSTNWSPEGEAKRQALNEWIRTSGVYDAVIDFAAATQDPDQPTRMLAEHDSGDHLHPSPAGYTAMANSIDLELFRVTNP